MEEITAQGFWGRVDDALRARGMTLKELSSAIGASYDTVMHWRANARMPRAAELYEIASLLRIPMETLLSGESREDEEIGALRRDPRLREIVRHAMRDETLLGIFLGICQKADGSPFS